MIGHNTRQNSSEPSQIHWLNKKLESQTRKIALLEKKLNEKESYINNLQTDFENILYQLQSA